MKEIPSGEIAPNVSYQVIGGTSVTYNSIEVLAGNFFIGIAGVTTYSESGGAKVYEASEFKGVIFGIEHYKGEYGYPEESYFSGTLFGLGEILPYYESYSVTERKQNATPNGFNDWGYKILINARNDEYIEDLTGQSSGSPALTYSQLLEITVDNNNVSADVDADGIITNFKVQRID